MRKNILLILSMVMFIITSLLMFLIPTVVYGPLDGIQIALIILLAIMGYGSSAAYLWFYKDKA